MISLYIIKYEKLQNFFYICKFFLMFTSGKAVRRHPAYKKIHDMMLDEEVVGGDETTENINGVLKWLWTWRSERLTC